MLLSRAKGYTLMSLNGSGHQLHIILDVRDMTKTSYNYKNKMIHAVMLFLMEMQKIFCTSVIIYIL